VLVCCFAISFGNLQIKASRVEHTYNPDVLFETLRTSSTGPFIADTISWGANNISFLFIFFFFRGSNIEE
jgi:hypothetical protein